MDGKAEPDSMKMHSVRQETRKPVQLRAGVYFNRSLCLSIHILLFCRRFNLCLLAFQFEGNSFRSTKSLYHWFRDSAPISLNFIETEADGKFRRVFLPFRHASKLVISGYIRLSTQLPIYPDSNTLIYLPR